MSTKEIMKRVCVTLIVMLSIPVIIMIIISLTKILAQKLNLLPEELLFVTATILLGVLAVIIVITIIFIMCYICVDSIFTRIQLAYNQKKLLSLEHNAHAVDKRKAEEIYANIKMLKEHIRNIEHHNYFS